MKINHLIKTSMVALFLVNSSLAGTEVENPTDPLRDLFTQARASAQDKVRTTEFCKNDPVLSSKEGQWIIKNQKDLEYDIQNSKHVWSQQSANTCVKTELKSLAPLKFSFPACKNSSKIDFLTAERMLIHESVHHFNIADEAFAERVANLVQKYARLGRACDQIGFDPNKDPVRVIELGDDYNLLSRDRILIYDKNNARATLIDAVSGKKIKSFPLSSDAPRVSITLWRTSGFYFALFHGGSDSGVVTFYRVSDGKEFKSYQYSPQNIHFFKGSQFSEGYRTNGFFIDPSLKYSYEYREFWKPNQSKPEGARICLYDLEKEREHCQTLNQFSLFDAWFYIEKGEGVFFRNRKSSLTGKNICTASWIDLKTMKEKTIFKSSQGVVCKEISVWGHPNDRPVLMTRKQNTQNYEFSLFQLDIDKKIAKKLGRTIDLDRGSLYGSEILIKGRYLAYKNRRSVGRSNSSVMGFFDFLSSSYFEITTDDYTDSPFGLEVAGPRSQFLYINRWNLLPFQVFHLGSGRLVKRLNFNFSAHSPNARRKRISSDGQHIYTIEGNRQYRVPFKLFVYKTGLK